MSSKPSSPVIPVHRTVTRSAEAPGAGTQLGGAGQGFFMGNFMGIQLDITSTTMITYCYIYITIPLISGNELPRGLQA